MIIVSIAIAAASPSAGCPENPVYVSVAGHIEDNDAYYLQCSVYERKRAELLKWADLILNKSVAFNLQVSYEWLLGVQTCETAMLMASTTNNVNVLEYLSREPYNFEIDPHQEGANLQDTTSGNNFADIVYVGRQVVPSFSNITGFRYDKVQQFLDFRNGTAGLLHPSFVWKPTTLAGGVHSDHSDMHDFEHDLTPSGVWMPKGFGTEADFYEHDSTSTLNYIGSGPNQYIGDWGKTKKACHWNISSDYVSTLAQHACQQFADDGGVAKIFTFLFVIPQSIILDSSEFYKFEAIMNGFDRLRDANITIIEHLSAVSRRWVDQFHSEPHIFKYSEISAAEYDNCDKGKSNSNAPGSSPTALPPINHPTLPPIHAPGASPTTLPPIIVPTLPPTNAPGASPTTLPPITSSSSTTGSSSSSSGGLSTGGLVGAIVGTAGAVLVSLVVLTFVIITVIVVVVRMKKKGSVVDHTAVTTNNPTKMANVEMHAIRTNLSFSV